MKQRWYVCVLGFGCAALISDAASAQAEAPAVPYSAEFIIKFDDQTRANAIVTEAMRQNGSPSDDLDLARLTERLSDVTSIPLRPVQVTSGRELLVSLDLQAIVHRAVGQLEADPAVLRAELRPHEPRVAQSGSLEFLVELRSEQQSMPDPATQRRLATALGETFAVELQPAPQAIVAVVRLADVAARVIDDLRALPEVTYVQPNYLLQPHPRPEAAIVR